MRAKRVGVCVQQQVSGQRAGVQAEGLLRGWCAGDWRTCRSAVPDAATVRRAGRYQKRPPESKSLRKREFAKRIMFEFFK